MTQRIFHTILLFTSLFSYGQVTLMAIAEDKDLKVNEKFTVTFVLEINGDDYVQESKLLLPDLSKFKVLGYGSDQNTFVDPKKNIVVNQIIYQVALEPKTTGTARIGSALVQVNGRMHKTEPIDLNVKEVGRKNNADEMASNDLYLNMEVDKKEVYTNQPTIAVLRAYSRDYGNFRKVNNIDFANQNNLDVQLISNKKSDIETRGEISSQVVAVFMIFPTESGKIEIGPVTANVKHKEAKILSNSVDIKVKKLPAGSPESFKNAVGKFSVDLNRKATENVEVNQPVDVVVKLKGEGNLLNVDFPKLLANENIRIFPPKITKNISSGNSGYVAAHYVVIPQKAGPLHIETEAFSYFDPHTKNYVELGSKALLVSVKTHAQILDSKSTLEKVNEYTQTVIQTVNTPLLKISVLEVKEKNRLHWRIILLNVAIFFGGAFFLFYLRKMRIKKKVAVRNQRRNKIETIADLEQKLQQTVPFTLSQDLNRLQALETEQNANGFFKAFGELVENLSQYAISKNFDSLDDFIVSKIGRSGLEKYQMIHHKISIEKYAPSTSADQIGQLNAQIQNLFSQITK